MAREKQGCLSGCAGCVGNAIVLFVVIFALLCLTHDWKGDRAPAGGSSLEVKQSVDKRKP